ncbi:MAG: DUF1080 domain-containing protein [Planctomycetes bacterium]|nr:DUF1080 domain-containing protein [Planctomycetota bacterium]
MMKMIQLRVVRLIVAACVLLLGGPVAQGAHHLKEEGFKSIFDGVTLAGWEGKEGTWRVEDRAITGQTTQEKPLKGNTFIIWQGGDLDDFELKLEYRIVGGNSGIQYRSEHIGNYVIKGYQADFEDGEKYSGINYHEKGRGILALRGQKTIVGDGKNNVKVVGSLGDPKELMSHIKKHDWNEFHIIAKGNHLVHKINGRAMSEVTDEGVKDSRRSGVLALQLHAGPAMKVQFRNIRLKRLPMTDKRKVVFVAGKRSHGYGSHEHNAGCLLLAAALNETMANIQTVVYRDGGWPKDPTAFDNADGVVFYCDGGGGHYANKHLAEFDKVVGRGVGLVCLHYGVEVPAGAPGNHFLKWIGGYFEANWSVNPHWTAEFKMQTKHPIANGVKPFSINDEWYYHMRFQDKMQGVTPILSALPGAETLKRKDGAHSGNPHVRAAVARGEIQHVAWAYERPDGGRGFGFTGGHFHRNWANDSFRKVVLNAIAWVSKVPVPANGIESKTPTQADLEANQDYPRPGAKKKSNWGPSQGGYHLFTGCLSQRQQWFGRRGGLGLGYCG